MRMATVLRALSLLMLLSLLAAPPVLRAAPFDGQPKILLHITPVTNGNACGPYGRLADCGTATTSAAITGGLYDNYHYVYVLVAPADPVPLGGVQFGITYDGVYDPNGTPAHPVVVYSWTNCGSLEFSSSGWPAPGGGNIVTWSQAQSPGGETVVAGYFYMGAYAPGTMGVTLRPIDCAAKVADWTGLERDIPATDLGQISFYTGTADPGCNPCLEDCPPIPLPGPQPPTNLAAVPGCNSVIVSWTGSLAASGFRIKRDGVLINSGYPVYGTTYTDTDPGPGPHCYNVSTIICDVESAFSTETACAAPDDGPGITQQPVPLTVLAGDAASFTVSVTSTNPVTYRWRRNGVNLNDGPNVTGATTDHLTLSNLTVTDDGTLSVVISSSCPTLISNGALLTVCGQPIPTGLRTTSLCTDVALTWDAVAGISGYRLKRDGAVISGAGLLTGVTFTDPAPPPGEHCYEVASEKCGVTGVDSAPLCVTPLIPASITTPPAATQVQAGANVTLTVVAAGSPTLTYHWRKAGVALTDGGTLSGVLTDQLTITGVVLADAGSYDVVVSNDCNSVTSAAALLTVCDQPTPTGLATTSLCTDVSLTWNAVAGVDGYRVKRDGALISGPTAITATTFTDVAPAAGEHCYEVASEDCAVTGTYSAPLCVTPLIPASITTPPAATQVQAGTNVTLTVVAAGSPTLTYHWRKAGVALTDGGTLSGVLTDQLTITGVVLADAGSYDVVVSNGCNSVTSAVAELTVCELTPPTGLAAPTRCTAVTLIWNPVAGVDGYRVYRDGLLISGPNPLAAATYSDYLPPAGQLCYQVASVDCGLTGALSAQLCTSLMVPVSLQPLLPANRTLPSGGTLSLTVNASGDPTLQYQWKRNGIALSDVGTTGGTTTANLTIGNLGAANAGAYMVTVTNPCGSQTSTAVTVTICTAPVITVQPASVTRNIGQTATFNVGASGTGLSYQWRHDGVNVGTNSSSLSLPGITPASAGYYDVVVTNSCTSVTSTAAYLTVICSPALSLQSTFPQNVTVGLGSPATFTARVQAGCSPYTYQWRKEGVSIGAPITSGSTQNVYSIPSVSAADAGYYSCYVSSASGALLSRIASLNAPTVVVAGLGASQSCPNITVTWTTTASTTCVLHYGSTPSMTQTFSAGSGTTFSATVPFTGPATLYYQVTTSSGSPSAVQNLVVPAATANLVVSLITYPAYTNEFGANNGIRIGIRVTNTGCGAAGGTLQMTTAKLKTAFPRDPATGNLIPFPRFIVNGLAAGQSIVMPVEFSFIRNGTGGVNMASGSTVTFTGKLQWGGPLLSLSIPVLLP